MAVEAPDDGWLSAVPGARAAGRDDGAVLVALEEDADDQALLAAARAAGPVRAFAPDEPRLADVFREAVAP